MFAPSTLLADTRARTSSGESVIVSAARLLRSHGHGVRRVYWAWSAGDSDFGMETIGYVDLLDRPRTALLRIDGVAGMTVVDVHNGW